MGNMTGGEQVRPVIAGWLEEFALPGVTFEVLGSNCTDNVAHFSWTPFKLRLESGSPQWKQAMDVATIVYDGRHTPVVPGALFYHATYVKPYWASSKREVARIGNHIFYR